MLQEYKHEKRTKPQHSPYSVAPNKYGAAAQDPMGTDDSPDATKDEITQIQGVMVSISYYACAVDLTFLVVLSTIASKQAKATNTTIENTGQLLDYLATYPDVKLRLCASDMIFNVHSDTSYFSIIGTKSLACGIFFLG